MYNDRISLTINEWVFIKMLLLLVRIQVLFDNIRLIKEKGQVVEAKRILAHSNTMVIIYSP